MLDGAADAGTLPELDFNGDPRAGDATVGAYVFDANGNPGWEIGPGLTHWTAALRFGSGQNGAGFLQLTPPLIGEPWVTAVDLAGEPGALASLLALGFGGPTGGAILSGIVNGELLVLPPFELQLGTGVHAVPIPADPLLVGLPLSSQGGVLTFGGVQLQNALDVTLGDF